MFDRNKKALFEATAFFAIRLFLLCLGLVLTACGEKDPAANSSTPASSVEEDTLAAKAQAGDKEAMLVLAKDFASGIDGRPKNEFEAFKWYLRAAEAGAPSAMSEVAERYQEGRGVRQDYDAARPWVDKAVALQDPKALFLAVDTWYLTPFVDPDGWETIGESEKFERAFSLLNQAADAGNVDAKVLLAVRVRHGIVRLKAGKKTFVVPPDTERALRLLKDAADAGSVEAKFRLAAWYQQGGEGLKRDAVVAANYWDQLEATTDPKGQFTIGDLLRPETSEAKLPFEFRLEEESSGLGSGIWRDRRLPFRERALRARDWFEKAAKQDHVFAALQAGRMYSKAEYGFKDEGKAFRYLSQAAEAGLIDAQLEIAGAYYTGQGVAKDFAQSFRWMHRAATHQTASAIAMANAQRFLSYMLWKGEGVDQDVVLAYAWANVSAAAGNAEAKKILAALDQSLDAAQIREAQRLSTAWKLGDDIKRTSEANAQSPNSTASNSADAATAKLAVAGTGFFVTEQGHLVTNFHVGGKCKEVKLPALNAIATFVAGDAANDLAVLRAAGVSPKTARLSDSSGLRQGQEVVAFGYPLEGYLPSAGNITTGLLSALAGPGNNTSLIQISAPIQQGNSGGPVLDLRGNVVGVVVGKADAIRIAKATGDIPQNVNFAVSVGTLQGFLDASRIDYKRSSFFSFDKKPDAIADEARRYTMKLECWR